MEPEPGNDKKDLVDGMPVKQSRQLTDVAYDTDTVHLFHASAGLVIDRAEDLEAPIRMFLDHLDKFGGPLSCPDDKDPSVVVSPPARKVGRAKNQAFLQKQQACGVKHKEDKEQPADVFDLQKENNGTKGKNRKNGAFDDRPQKFEKISRPHGLVHAVDVQHPHPERNDAKENHQIIVYRSERTRHDLSRGEDI